MTMMSRKAKLNKIPGELKMLVGSTEIYDVLEEIAEEFDIPETWRGEFIRPVFDVLVGDLKPKDFVPVLSDNLAMPADEALMLARKVNEKIFSSVKPFLAQLYEIEDEKIARKLKVPRKPKVITVGAAFSEGALAVSKKEIEQPSIVEAPIPPQPILPGRDTAPIEVIPPPVQPTFAPEEPPVMLNAVPSPMTMHFAQAPAPVSAVAPAPEVVIKTTEPTVEEKPTSNPTILTQKLGGMRASSDTYRESIE